MQNRGSISLVIVLSVIAEEVITLTQELRDCSSLLNPIATGDLCLDQATVDSLTAYLPDPATTVPPNLSMLNITFHGSSRSICVCDSSDNCIPPSPAKPAPEPASGKDADVYLS